MIHIVPNWLSASECEMLKRRWRRSHGERGYVLDGARTEYFDRRVKYRLDHFLYQRAMHNWLSRLTRKALRPLGFRGSLREPFRIGRYGRGGHSSLHTDCIQPREWSIVCVLSQPSSYSGGALRFPEIGVALRPPAGFAIFFDPRLSHKVDPVRSGSRFVLVGFASAPLRS
jgi:predicted 2-oxoglutarate/Fe(II)-dependent dioxygenase YbiX